MTRTTLLTALAATATAFVAHAAPDTRCFEMRVYYANEGKLDALHARFRDHTTKLFEKHGMTNLGYWVPTENPDRKLVYVLAYPDRAAREASWKGFLADPDWKAAAAASEVNGKLVAKIESTFLKATDYSPVIAPSTGDAARTFELRTYTATPGKLANLNARFRDHTLGLFNKHGMTHIGYWTLEAGQPGADDTLVYIIAHASPEARAKNFDAFRADPAWIAAKEASEKAAGGSLTVKDGVKSVVMAPTDYSLTR